MGCQVTKEEDEKANDQQSNNESTTETMTNRAKAAAEYKSRLEWKLCVVSFFSVYPSKWSNSELKIVCFVCHTGQRYTRARVRFIGLQSKRHPVWCVRFMPCSTQTTPQFTK